MRRKLTTLAAAVALVASLLFAPAADATSRSVIIHNSSNSESYLGIVNFNAVCCQWSLQPGYTANNRAGAANADTRGYYIGPGWCARLFVMRLDVPNSTWIYVGTTGSGYKFPVNYQARIYGVETHPANRGGVHGCG